MTFIDFARSHGIEIDKLFPSDRIQRCGTTAKPKSTNGAYFWDGARGWVMDWADDTDIHWFGSGEKREWTDEEKRVWIEQKRAKELRQHRDWAEAAKRGQDLLGACELKTHYYLNSKGLPDVLGFVAEDVLVVPMRNFETNALQGVQMIEWDAAERKYDKKMNWGMRAKGAVLRLGPKQAKETFLAEGYATGLSIEMACRQLRLNAAVMVCFSASNMEYVAGKMSGRMFVVADNDKSQTGENAAKRIGAPYCMSEIEGEDANDLHQRAGLLALCSMLMNVRRECAVT